MAFVLFKNKPWGDRVECKDRLEREMLKEKGSRRAQIPADDKQWISVCLSRGPSEILHCTFSDLWLGLILHLKRLLFSPSTLFIFPPNFFALVYKRKVEHFQIPHGSEIFAFHSVARNTESLFLRAVWSSNPQNLGSNCEGLCGRNVPAALAEPLEAELPVEQLPERAAASRIALFAREEAEHSSRGPFWHLLICLCKSW